MGKETRERHCKWTVVNNFRQDAEDLLCDRVQAPSNF